MVGTQVLRIGYLMLLMPNYFSTLSLIILIITYTNVPIQMWLLLKPILDGLDVSISPGRVLVQLGPG